MIPFLITVDTEADNQWKGGGAMSLENIKAIPRFQSICERYGFVPTYLITYEVTQDSSAVKYLKELWDTGRAEIGTHLHPWTTPPYFNMEEEQSQMHFPSELDDEVMRTKFITLHEAIVEKFERSPKTFRAGRWGYDHRLGKLLDEFGYTADVSITPLIDWKRTIKGGLERAVPNFVHASIYPWVIRNDLLELPMTILPRGPIFISRLANYLGRGTLFTQWCRIFGETTLAELIYTYERAEKLKLQYCMFMIHSSEFIVGSPYTKSQSALDHHFAIFEDLLAELRNRGAKGLTVNQMRKEIEV